MRADASISGERLQAIAEMYRRHSGQLEGLVTRRGSTHPQYVQDACSYAWLQLLTHPEIDLGPPRWRALAWLTQTAIWEAWRCERRERRACVLPPDQLEDVALQRNRVTPSSEQIVLSRLRLDLVAQLPERPRRFLLRLALGYSYDEIAAAEHATYTTTNKQIAKAKRLLRALENHAREGGESAGAQR